MSEATTQAVVAGRLLINHQWIDGAGAAFTSFDPSLQLPVWRGGAADAAQVDAAAAAARAALPAWSALSFAEREGIARAFGKLLERDREHLARVIAQETGKPLWETRTEVTTMIGKIDLSVRAYHQRTGTSETANGSMTAALRHKPHGVVAVYGPYNFPGHLPNGHIVPALLAGNTVLFKPSELTPWVAEETVKLWLEAGLPAGVLNLLQGERETGAALAQHVELDGLYFTGSARTGHLLAQQFAATPHKILALEMGGNNPLIVSGYDDLRPVLHDVLQSGYLSSGQRCTCARRLYVPRGAAGDALVSALIEAMRAIRVDRAFADPQPFMGPLISARAAQDLLAAQQRLLDLGAVALVPMQALDLGPAFVSPALLDATAIAELPDDEYFGPLVQLIRYDTLEQAVTLANRTRYGLSASLLSPSREEYEYFWQRIRAGIVNWNRPTNGASGAAPFGGVGASGNHRPSAFYAADYCAYPVASVEALACELPASLPPGLTL